MDHQLTEATDTGYEFVACPPLPPLDLNGQRALRVRARHLEAEQAARRWYCGWLKDEMERTADAYQWDQHSLRAIRELLFMRGLNDE